MIVALEVLCPDSPRSIPLDDVREAIVEALSDQLDGLELELCLFNDSGREFYVRADCSCIQELEPESARAAGFTIDPTEV